MPFDHAHDKPFAPVELVRQHRAIALILIGFILLGTVYSVVTPLFEASDELWHYPFVKHLADGGGLPVQDSRIEQPWRQEGSQPPLYYALGALATFWIDTSDFEEVRWLNPHADIGVETADGNLNMVVHSERESFPYRGTALAVHIVRFLSVLMGALTVLCTYLIALEVFSEQKTLAAGAAAFNALVPMFLFISGSVNNDNLTILLCSLTLLLLVRLVRGSRPSSQMSKSQTVRLAHDRVPNLKWSVVSGHWSLLGLVIGLGALSKASALGLIPLTALGLALSAWQRRAESVLRRLAQFFGSFVTVLAVSLAVAGWWYLRNWLLYRDPLGLNTFVAFVGPRLPQPTLRQLLGEWEGFLKTFWGLFGGVNVAMEPAAYWMLNAIALLGALGLVIPLARWLSRMNIGQVGNLSAASTEQFPIPNSQFSTLNSQLSILTTWPIILFLALIRWTTITKASQGRLMFPAISAVAILLALGWSQWAPRLYVKWLLGIVGGLMFVLAATAPFRYIAPAYAKPVLSPALSKVEGIVEGPVLLSEAELEGIPHRLDVTFGDKARLLGYETGDEETRPGESVEVTLYWQSLAEMDRDYTVFVHLLDENDLVIAQRDTYPGLGTYPTSLWRVDDVFADRYVLTLPPTVFAPCTGRFEVGLYDFASGERLMATGPDGQPLGDNVRYHQIAVLPREDSPLPNPVDFDFEGRIALAGYDLDRRTVRPGETIHLTLYWQALAEMEEDYTVFTHLLGEEDRLWAQMDSQPQGGAAPTSSWQVDQVIEDHYDLTVKPDTPPDVYDIEVGLYLAATGRRLGVLDEGGRLRDNRVLLSKVRVVSP
jgi:4-amino-4-deoxy-L-arabinose transferase-like glycosyltransferase